MAAAGATTPASLVQLDSCRQPATDEARQVGTRSKDLALAKVESTDRFNLYRSDAIQNTQERAPPDLGVSVPTDRTLLFSQVTGFTKANAPEFGSTAHATNAGTTFVDRSGQELEVVSAFVPSDGIDASVAVSTSPGTVPRLVVKLPLPLSSSVADTIEADLLVASLGLIPRTLSESTADSRRFVSEDGSVVFVVTDPPGDSPTDPDVLEGQISYTLAEDLVGVEVPATSVSLVETGPDTRAFSNLRTPERVNLPVADPRGAVFRILRVTEHDSAVETATVATPVESKTISLTRVGPHLHVSDELVSIPEGADPSQLPPGFELTVIRTRFDGSPTLNLTVTGSGDKSRNPLPALAFYAVNPDVSGVLEAFELTEAVRAILRGPLGIPVTQNTQLPKSSVLGLVSKHSVWYSGTHAFTPGKPGRFEAIVLLSPSADPEQDALLRPEDLPEGLSYELVFFDGCMSAQNLTWDATKPDGGPTFTENPVTRAFIDKFNTPAWIGWQRAIPGVKLIGSDGYAAVTIAFFENLNKEPNSPADEQAPSVKKAFQDTVDDGDLDQEARDRLKLLSKAGLDPAKVIIDRKP